jgi:hypothetical protein
MFRQNCNKGLLTLAVGVLIVMLAVGAAFAGNIIYMANGSNPSKLYVVDLGALDNTADNQAYYLMMDFSEGSGTYHAIAVTPNGQTLVGVDRNGTAVVTVDLTSLPLDDVLECNLPGGFSSQVVQLAFAPDDDINVYATDRGDDLLFTFNYETCATNIIGVVNTPGPDTVDVEGADIAFDENGDLYLLTNNEGRRLYLVDPSDATAVEVGPFDPNSNNMGMTAFKNTPSVDDILIAANNNDKLYELSKINGDDTNLGKLGFNGGTLNINSGDLDSTYDLCATRTAGFWGNHPNVVDDYLNTITCGFTLLDVENAMQDLCFSGKDFKQNDTSPEQLQLIRQCAAANLNIAATVDGEGNCDPLTLARIHECCNKEGSVCNSGKTPTEILNSGCIYDIDAFNKSMDTLEPDPFEGSGKADSGDCKDARGDGVVNDGLRNLGPAE